MCFTYPSKNVMLCYSNLFLSILEKPLKVCTILDMSLTKLNSAMFQMPIKVSIPFIMESTVVFSK